MDTSPLLSRPGAVAVEGGAVAGHYGDPLREQRLLAEGAGLVDRGDRDVLTVAGADRLTWLHSLTSQHLEQLPDRTGTEALLLSPNGHVEHHLALTELDGVVWADVEPGTGEALQTFLARMRLHAPRRARPGHRRAGRCSRWSDRGGTTSSPRPGSRCRPCRPPSRRWPAAAGRGACRRSATAPRSSTSWCRVRTSTGWPTRCSPPARAWPAGDALEALRVEARRPRLGVDTDHRTIPNEVQWLQTAVHLQKGCYRGQETVARVHNLGRPPRRLVLLHLDGVSEDLPAPGTPVLLGAREVGRVGTVVRHHELGVVALALVKQSVAADAELTVGGSRASVDPDDAPAALDDAQAAARERVRAVRSGTMLR